MLFFCLFFLTHLRVVSFFFSLCFGIELFDHWPMHSYLPFPLSHCPVYPFHFGKFLFHLNFVSCLDVVCPVYPFHFGTFLFESVFFFLILLCSFNFFFLGFTRPFLLLMVFLSDHVWLVTYLSMVRFGSVLFFSYSFFSFRFHFFFLYLILPFFFLFFAFVE